MRLYRFIDLFLSSDKLIDDFSSASRLRSSLFHRNVIFDEPRVIYKSRATKARQLVVVGSNNFYNDCLRHYFFLSVASARLVRHPQK